MINQDCFTAISLGLGAIWFIGSWYANRDLRRRLRRLENNICEVAPAIHVDRLEIYFRQRRNQEGVMLMQAVAVKLHEKVKRQPKAPTPSQ